MAIVSVNEDTKDRRAERGIHDRPTTRSFIVITDDPADGPIAARNAISDPNYLDEPVFLGSPHPEDTSIHAKRFTPHERERLVFDITVQYGPFTRGSLEQIENPLLRTPEVMVETTTYVKVFERDLDDKPVVNSFGQPLDPGLEVPVSFPRLIVIQNEPLEPPAWEKVWAHDNTINAEEWKGADPNTLKVRLRARRLYEYDTIYWQVTYELEYNKLGWDKEGHLLDTGTMSREWSEQEQRWIIERITDDDGNPIVDPWPLNGNGKAMTPQEIQDAQLNPSLWSYRIFRTYDESDFSALGIGI